MLIKNSGSLCGKGDTTLLHDGENDLCLRVQDDPDCTQPRGKQYWDRGLMGCWYTPVSGIWQTVYLG